MSTPHHKILIPHSVKIALQKQVDYIAIEQQEPLLAVRWLNGIVKAIQSLEKFPERCAIAPENYYLYKDTTLIIRNLIYKKTFRIIFIVIKNEVKILSIRHSAKFK